MQNTASVGNWILVYLVFCLISCSAGCSGRPEGVEDHSRDPERYAMNVKQMVFAAIESAKQSREPGDELWPVILELEQKDRPRRPYEEVYEGLEKKLREIYQLCQESSSGRPPNLQERLQEVLQVAEKLPGTVAVGRWNQD